MRNLDPLSASSRSAHHPQAYVSAGIAFPAPSSTVSTPVAVRGGGRAMPSFPGGLPQGSATPYRQAGVFPSPAISPPPRSTASSQRRFGVQTVTAPIGQTPYHPVPAVMSGTRVMENPDIDLSEIWLSKKAQMARREANGLESQEVADFLANREFVGLGSFCGVSRALQAISLKAHAYPFDWVRTPAEGIIHCLETDFDDFLTFTVPPEDGAQFKVYKYARWGGSFWHHDPEAPSTRATFQRRVERLLGLECVPANQRRIFVWAPNSTRELEETQRLQQALRKALPEAEELRLIVLVDLQSVQGLYCLEDDNGANVLFYRVHEEIFTDQGKQWSMEKCAENYSKAIALAVRYWAIQDAAPRLSDNFDVAPPVVERIPDIVAFLSLCEQMEGGNPGSEGYWPRRFMGQRFAIACERQHDNDSMAEGDKVATPSTAASPGAPSEKLPGLLPPVADVVVPQGASPGNMIEVEAFGRRVRLQVPEGIVAGQLLRLKLLEGMVTFAVVAAAMTTTTTATATAALVATAAAAASTSSAPIQHVVAPPPYSAYPRAPLQDDAPQSGSIPLPWSDHPRVATAPVREVHNIAQPRNVVAGSRQD